jgi:hypothetical protein
LPGTVRPDEFAKKSPKTCLPKSMLNINCR